MKCFRILVGFALLAVVLPVNSRVLAQDSPIDTLLAYQYFQEAHALCSRDNGKLWEFRFAVQCSLLTGKRAR